jgi:CRISPR-associated protein Cmr1
LIKTITLGKKIGSSPKRKYGLSLKTIEATFEIVTPMFLGDADHEAKCIRPQSVRGALAFWWRALYFSKYENKDNLKKQEIKLFGGPAGQGRFSLRVGGTAEIERLEKKQLEQILNNSAGSRYFGYGVVGKSGRACLKSGGKFTVRILFHPGAREDDVKEIVEALKLFGLLGGLGSRVRRGYGSIALESLSSVEGIHDNEPWKTPESQEGYVSELQLALSNVSNDTGTNWPITAFAGDTECRIMKEGKDDPLAVLNELGEKMLFYRSYGKNGRVAGTTAEQNFKDDHDWFKQSQSSSNESNEWEQKNFVPKRTAFGMPHNYFSHPNRNGYVTPKAAERRASPLFFHVHKIGSNYFGIVTFFPTIFLQNEKVIMKITQGKRNDKETLYENKKDYDFNESVIINFLEEKFSFSEADVILPAPTEKSEDKERCQ